MCGAKRRTTTVGVHHYRESIESASIDGTNSSTVAARPEIKLRIWTSPPAFPTEEQHEGIETAFEVDVAKVESVLKDAATEEPERPLIQK